MDTIFVTQKIKNMTTKSKSNKSPISEELSAWLQIAQGLTTNDLLYLAKKMPDRIGILEQAATAIATVLDRRCPSSPNRLN